MMLRLQTNISHLLISRQVANAGKDKTVNSGESVTLDGSGSRDPDGSIASYSWKQTAGPAVTLNGADTATAQFVAPSSDTLLKFSLIVKDDKHAASNNPAIVSVTVKAAPELTIPPLAKQPPYLGLKVGTVTSDLAQNVTGIPTTNFKGIFVDTITKNGPADKAGIHGSITDQYSKRHIGDIVVAVDGHPLVRSDDLISYIEQHKSVGDSVTLTVYRNGQKLDLKATLTTRPSSFPSNTITRITPTLIEKGTYPIPYLGLTGVTLNSNLAETLNYTGELPANVKGIIVNTIAKYGPADMVGVHGITTDRTQRYMLVI